MDKVRSDSACGKAVREMQSYDPAFDVEDLSFEV